MTELSQKLLAAYADAVAKSPSHLHLTSEANRDNFLERHVEDAIHFHRALKDHEAIGPTLLDVGTGNGIPGVPLAILEPESTIFMLDSDSKKIGFLDMFCKSNAIENVRFLYGRAENIAHEEHREHFPTVTCRALAKLPTAIELAGAFVAPGGRLIVSHGTTLDEELMKSEKAMRAMGLEFEAVVPYWTEKSPTFRALLLKKVGAPQKNLPRRVGIPEKRPL